VLATPSRGAAVLAVDRAGEPAPTGEVEGA